MKTTTLAFLIFFVVLFAFGDYACAATRSRAELIERALNCAAVSQHQASQVSWVDVCSTSTRDNAMEEALSAAQVNDKAEGVFGKKTMAVSIDAHGAVVAAAPAAALTSEQTTAAPVKHDDQDVESATPDQKSEISLKSLENVWGVDEQPKFFWPTLNRDDPHSKFELGPDMYAYGYREPSLHVKDTGTFYGVFASYTYRWHDNRVIEGFKDIVPAGDNLVNLFRIDGRFNIGQVDYDGSGTFSGISDYVGEIRGVVGYDMHFPNDVLVMPYLGVGYRYLLDKFSELPAQTIDGDDYYSGYDRESRYAYIPLGIEGTKKFQDGWTVVANGEYDFLVSGEQTSHFEDMRDLSGADPGIDPLKNKQKRGMGARTSLRIMKEMPKVDFFFEPFVRYWHIEKSELNILTVGGSPIPYVGWEPDNNTFEYGVRLGLRY